MLERSVCAVIVTYHPSARMIDTLSNVLQQVQGLVVVDNGSSADELRPLRDAGQRLGFHLIENEENLGIAKALNQGVYWAMQKDFPWVVLFDQDSRITESFVDLMFATWEAHPDRERLCSVHPKYIDPETRTEALVRRAGDGGPIVSMTSGALMPAWVFKKLGMFASDFFIDEVDTEYCLRARAAGYLIADSRSAVLLHSSGHPRRASFLWFRFRPGDHSAIRRYYMSRNRVVVYARYFDKFPRWIMLLAFVSLRETIKCFIAEDNRFVKLRNCLLGVWDGLTGRLGKREGI
jgi:rhamnosyltransferase